METLLFVEYPKCSTCQKAKKWLEQNKVLFNCRHIVEEKPSVDELKLWWQKSGKELKSFFNTSGLIYKSLGLKDKLPMMNESEKLDLLASNGMLVKRPLLVGKDFVCVGFKETEWQSKI